MSIEEIYQIYLQYPVICTDTRKISEGCLFFALKGENFNGNSFAEQALEFGAAYAFIEEKEYAKNENYIIVDNVLQTLQQLARYHRQQFNIPFIGITGTNGKTTTKELIHSVLSQKYKTHATQGNLNNHIGVPLTLLSISSDTEIAIIEMGANHQHEIEQLCGTALPTHGLITNVGKAHLEGFGGFEGVKKAKGELYDFLKQSDGTIFINHENAYLMEMGRQRSLQHCIFYGQSENCYVKGNLTVNDPYLTFEWIFQEEKYRVKSNLTGSYNLENLLAAVTIGAYFKLSADEINTGIAAYLPSNNRSQLTKTETNTLVCDYYNANPSSMAAALDNFAAIDTENKALILGDMFELGDEAPAEHQLILEKAEHISASRRIFIGKEFYQFKDKFKGNFFIKTDEAAVHLKDVPIQNAAVLIKGSRGMQLEKLIAML